MAERSNSRMAFFNGRYVPEREVLIPFRDRSFVYGDGCFDMTRTFRGKPFKLEEHIGRFYQSLSYLAIDIEISFEEMTRISEKVLDLNRHLLKANDDYWIAQRVSRGLRAAGDEGWEHNGPSVIVECQPLPFKARAHLYSEGIRVAFPSVRRVPPECISPRTKSHNYLNFVLANLEVHANDPDAWAVLLDINGNICEGMGSNFFLVKDGRLITPKAQYVLAGVSRQTVIELARDLGIVCEEVDIDLYDAYTADECFLTSTSLCLCPVSQINGRSLKNENLPGPITQSLIDAYSNLVNCNIVDQYLSHKTD